MQNRIGIILFAVVISLLCLFYLSFSLVSNSINKDADEYARDTQGVIDYNKRQRYIDSLWNEPVYDLGITSFTLKEVKNFELQLGLDLQGGMHVVLEVSPVEILKALAGNSTDENFVKALENTKKLSVNSQQNFADIFFAEYERLAGSGQLTKVFANAANQGRIDFKTPETEVKRVISAEIDGAIDRSYQIIKTRIDKFGVTNPNVQRIPGTGRIQVELPGVDNPERVRKLLQGVAKLEFWEVWEPSEYTEYVQKANDYIVRKMKADKNFAAKIGMLKADGSKDAISTTENVLSSLSADSTNIAEPVADSDSSIEAMAQRMADSASLSTEVSPIITKLVRANPNYFEMVYEAQDTAVINRIFADEGVRNVLPQNLRFMWDVKPYFVQDGKSYYQFYPIKVSKTGKAPLDGEAVADASQGFDERGRPDISMRMTGPGATAWRKLTAANVDRRIAIVLDGYVYSAPVVQGEIPNGSSSITGRFTLEEAKDLANILKVGKLPAPTRIVEEAVVGPSLGKEAIAQGLTSILIGFALVVVFMVIYYMGAGLVANAALLFNLFFIMGIMTQLQAALTLPGIAGIVLTIGMAVDANVLIFERIREELRQGKGLIAAINEGYGKAFWSIFDSNLTTLLTGFFLYTFGTGPIKGFAITLMVGIFCSFFTAVYVSRVIVHSITRVKGDKSNFSLGLPVTMNMFNLSGFDFLGKRKIAYVFSVALIIIGTITIFVQGGLNLGTDFKGGRTYIVEFKENVVASNIKSALLTNFENTGTEVKSYDTDNKVKVTTSYLIDDDSDEADAKVKAALESGLAQFNNLSPQILSSSKVGATIASDIRDSALQAIIASLLAIFGYILIRFRKWQFGLGAVVALFHDVLIVISCVAIARAFGFIIEVDQVFIAAVLTIIGYSINDTVVVFDRVRETFASSIIKNRDDITNTLNEAVNSTFSRTFITGITTFLVVFVLFIAGGEVLRGFSFALILGIIFGTYSSVFVASSIVNDTLKPEEFAQAEQPAVQKSKPGKKVAGASTV